jgi:hypothetical protein
MRRESDMRTTKTFSVPGYVIGLVAFLGVVSGWAQGLYIYPQKGQSPQQQDRDRYECHNWAVQQTGVDPTMAQAPSPSGGGVLHGAARGAALGAVGGAIAGDAGKGAAIGAATGGLFGGMRRAERSAQQQQYQMSGQDAYNRALTACMNGRDYTVQ